MFGDVCTRISPQGAVKVLEKMRRCWNSVPKKKIDMSSWAPVIRTLIVRISQSEKENQCMDIIENAVAEIYSGFFDIDRDNMPERKIITIMLPHTMEWHPFKRTGTG